jgi:16S rRNA processing protein RimM
VVVHLEGYPDRTAAEQLRGLWVQIPADQVMPLPEQEHYVFELVGLRVRTTDGRDLGQVAEVLITGANEVFVVEGSQGQVLIPYISEVVKREDFDDGVIWVEPVPGLLD